jgi:hypothetical protein
MAADEKKFEWHAHQLNEGLDFKLPDGRRATLLAYNIGTCTWLVMCSDSRSDVLSEEFILETLNNPTKEDNSDGTQAG